ncbi:TPA: YadA-like family protein [Stenotrophomonas maltophilia]|nr:YadA-like family protein [Stenotrophomonas maltophilia]
MTSISALLAPTPHGQLTLTTDTSYRDSTLDGNHLVVVGSRSSLRGSTSVGYGNLIDSNGERNVAVGYNVKVRRGYSTAIGGDAYSDGVGTVALGHFARAYSENSIAIGSGSATVNSSAGESRIAIGGNAYAGTAGYTGAIALGGESRAEYDAIAVGKSSQAKAEGALAVGRFARATGEGSLALGKDSGSTGKQAIALGQGANASGYSAFAIGAGAKAVAEGSIAFGYGANADSSARLAVALGEKATASHNSSVALGANSTTSASNQVSVGSSSLKRKIVNVADAALGTSSSEAVTGKQLYATNQALAATTITANAAKSTADSALSKANTLTGLLSQTSGSGNVRLGAANSGTVLDVRNSANGSRRITGVADGTLSTSSTEAVSGKQLHTTNQNVDAATTTANAAHTTANTAHATANTALVKVNVLDTLLSQASSASDVRLGAGNSGIVLDIGNRSGAARRITNVADGRLSAGSADAVSGRQLHATNELAKAQDVRLDGQGELIADNRNELERLRDAFEDFDPDLEGVVKFSADRSHVDMDGALVTGVGAGDIDSATSTDAVNGGQLFASNQRIGQMESVGRLMAFGDEAGIVAAGAGIYGVALGNGASASPTSEGGTAIGAYSFAMGMNSVAVGRGAYVLESSAEGFALGTSARVEETGGLAIGARAYVESGAENAVALGRASVAGESNTVSIGHASLQRRLTNLARGTAAHDAVAIDQLSDSLAALGGGAGLDSKGNIIRPNYTMQGRSQSTVGEALNVLDGAVVTQAEKTERVERQLGAMFQDGATVRADGIGQLNLAGANGMVLGNVANGLVAAGSRDAVNGGQLHAMQDQLNTRIDGVEKRIDEQPQPSLRTASASGDTPQPASAGDGDGAIAAAPPKAEAPAPDAPTPQVDTAELEKMLARANEYSDGISREVDRRLDKMDKRFNRMAAMTSAQSAMAMNTAGLNTYNRLGAGVGYSEGESAMAVGYQRVLNDKGSATFSLNGAFTNSGERSLGVGVGIGW